MSTKINGFEFVEEFWSEIRFKQQICTCFVSKYGNNHQYTYLLFLKLCTWLIYIFNFNSIMWIDKVHVFLRSQKLGKIFQFSWTLWWRWYEIGKILANSCAILENMNFITTWSYFIWSYCTANVFIFYDWNLLAYDMEYFMIWDISSDLCDKYSNLEIMFNRTCNTSAGDAWHPRI